MNPNDVALSSTEDAIGCAIAMLICSLALLLLLFVCVGAITVAYAVAVIVGWV